jgi:hypothetical protein
MDAAAYKQHCQDALARLADAARKKDEFAYLHAVLGINGGMEDAGWQPFDETRAFVADFVKLINSKKLGDHTKTRLALVVYCHITEANFIYHDVFNLLLAADGQPVRIFNFINKVQNGKPPSVNAKLADVKATADRMGHGDITAMFDEIWKPDIRNAVFHSDYILFGDKLRIKHRVTQYAEFPIADVFALLQKTLHLFDALIDARVKGLRSFSKGHKITGRMSPKGYQLSTIDVTVDDNGWAVGFSSSDPLPIW